MNGRGILASYFLSPLSIFTNPEKKSQFKLVKHPNSNKVNDLLKHNTIAVFLYNNLFTFLDTDLKFVLQGDLLKKIANRNYNADLAILLDKKLMFQISKEMKFDVKGPGNKSLRNRSFIRLLKPPANMDLTISTIFSSENVYELCNKLKI